VYKFIHEEPIKDGALGAITAHHTSRVEFSVLSDSDINEMCEAFEFFLRANGFSFDGNVQIVPDETDELIDYKSMQQDMTELNGDGNRERGRYGEDTHVYKPKRTSLWDAKPEEWDALRNKT